MPPSTSRVQTVYHYKGRWCVYTTKRDGKYHQFLCDYHKGRTYLNATRIVTEFVTGFNLFEPLVIGGTEITRQPQETR